MLNFEILWDGPFLSFFC